VPQHEIGERGVGEDDACPQERHRPHVGDDTNMRLMLQSGQHRRLSSVNCGDPGQSLYVRRCLCVITMTSAPRQTSRAGGALLRNE
jgi:hypothetical protein